MVGSVKYHLIPQIAQLKTTKEVYHDLTCVFETNNPNNKLALNNMLRDIKMTK